MCNNCNDTGIVVKKMQVLKTVFSENNIFGKINVLQEYELSIACNQCSTNEKLWAPYFEELAKRGKKKNG